MKKVNIFRGRFHLMAACSLIACGGAQAAITCSVSSNGFSSAYVPSNAGINITTASFTMTCTRSASTDATTLIYSVKVNNGSNPSGTQNQAASGANRITYDTFTDNTCATQWTKKKSGWNLEHGFRLSALLSDRIVLGVHSGGANLGSFRHLHRYRDHDPQRRIARDLSGVYRHAIVMQHRRRPWQSDI